MLVEMGTREFCFGKKSVFLGKETYQTHPKKRLNLLDVVDNILARVFQAGRLVSNLRPYQQHWWGIHIVIDCATHENCEMFANCSMWCIIQD